MYGREKKWMEEDQQWVVEDQSHGEEDQAGDGGGPHLCERGPNFNT